MSGIDVFCERCGARQADQGRRQPATGGFARRLVSAVNRTADGVPAPTPEMFLRLCLECRGYSCPGCWNEAARACQTCAPLPIVEPPRAIFEPAPAVAESVALETLVALDEPPRVEALAGEAVGASAEPPAVVEQPVVPEPVVALDEPPDIEAAVAEAIADEPVAVEPEAPDAAAEDSAVVPRVPEVPTTPAPPPPPPTFTIPSPAFLPTPVRIPDPVSLAPAIAPRPRAQISFETSASATPISSSNAYLEQAYLPRPTRSAISPALSASGVRPCRSCELPLSSKARFCRRCGTAQES